MAAATSALLVALTVCLLLISGGLATDGWPLVGDDDGGSALRLRDPPAPAGGTGSNGVAATSGTTLVGTVPEAAPFPAPPRVAAQTLAALSPVRDAKLPGLSARSPSRPESQAGRDPRRGSEERPAPPEGPKAGPVAQPVQEPITRVRIRHNRVRERARRDDRHSQGPERTGRRHSRGERRPDRPQPTHRAAGRPGRLEVRTARAERSPGQPQRVGHRAQRAGQRTEGGRDRAERRGGR